MTRFTRWITSIIFVAMGVLAVPTMAQDATTYTAQIIAGTCAAPGATVAAMTGPTAPSGAQQGASDAAAAASSYSAVPVSLDDLLTAPHALSIATADATVVSCGEIGGVRDGSGALVIGLRPANGSDLSGIAYLSPVTGNPGQTGISTFLAATVSGADTPGEPLDEETYAATVRSHITLVFGSIQRMDALFNQPHPDDPAWLNQVNAELSLWQLIYSEAQEIVPPASLADFHARYIEAIALLDSAAVDVRAGLEDEANAKIYEAVAAIRALDSTDQATPNPATPVAAGRVPIR